MKLSLVLLSVFATLGFATPNRPGCNANNCARAVTGTRLGATRTAAAFADCTRILALPTPQQTLPFYAVGKCPDVAKYSSACSCFGALPSDIPNCGGANLLTDPNNCGTCGNVCPSGACINGACRVDLCTGQVCGSFTNCSPDNAIECQCYSTADGAGFCASSQSCANLADCESTDDCAAGNVCIVGSCCTRNVCLPAQCGNPALKLRQLAQRAPGDGCDTNSC